MGSHLEDPLGKAYPVGKIIRLDGKRKKQRILNLGCNQRPLPSNKHQEIINVDIETYGRADIFQWNLEETPWPWETDSVDRILAYDLIEHIREWREVDGKLQYPTIDLMNEAWRVLKPGGVFEIMVPSDEGRGANQDPTHVSRWNANRFLYFAAVPSKPEDPESPLISHPWRALYPHLIKAAFIVRSATTQPNEQGIVYEAAELTKVHLPA
jgi:SAM-dependent methyltransferase